MATATEHMENLDTYKAIICQATKKKAYREHDFTAARMAEMIGVRAYTLSRIMKKAFGMSFPSMVNDLRVKDAMRYLKDPRLKGTTADDIGAMVGFGNRQTYYIEFKRRTGLTPAQYRKACSATADTDASSSGTTE